MTDIETIRGCYQLPGVGDCFTLEVWKLISDHSHRAKREIAQHLEKRVMPLRKPHIFQIVVLPARAHALLCRRRLVVIALFQPQKHVLELVHPRIREQQRGIPMRHQRRTPHPPVPLALKKAQEPFADLVPAPKFLAYRFTRHVRLSFAGFNPQIIADAAHPRNEPRVGSWASFRLCDLLEVRPPPVRKAIWRTMLPISSTHTCDGQ